MASPELIKAVKEYDEFMEDPKHRLDSKVINAYTLAVGTAFIGEKDPVFGLEVAAKAKKWINAYCFNQTGGGNIYDLESYSNLHHTRYELIDQWYSILLCEAPYRFHSYLLYLEKNRPEHERFYSPKLYQLNDLGLIQAMQDLEDDKLRILSISMPPGTGKCQPLDSLVLTPDGFIRMGDVKIGDVVIAGNGNTTVVNGVFPQGKKAIYEVTLECGQKCQCSAEHLWQVRTFNCGRCFEKVVTLSDIMWQKDRYLIPVTQKDSILKSWYLKINNIEYVGEKECQCIYVDDPCHLYITDDYIITHNTTLEKFFASWIIGKHPEDYSLFFSHSADITDIFYRGVLDICTNNTVYTFNHIFPEVKLESTNAKAQTINFGAYKPYASLQCTSVGSKNAGRVRANRYLYCDDLIGGIEEALNKSRLDKLWGIYSTDARQRKLNEQVKEIHIATRWSVHDVIGRLKTIYEGQDDVRFIAVPDIDPKTGDSNFDYKYDGMTVEFFNDQALAMDDISYKCLYKNEPIEREGLLYHDDDLRRYLDLPLREPDAIIGICDVKNKGTDFMFLPCCYQYDDDFYCVDCICDDNSDYGVQYSRLANIIVNHNMQQCEFESNSGGDRVSFEVNQRVVAMGGRCNITDKPTETNKETRIIVNADWVKKHVLFKDKSMYSPKEDYGVMMAWLLRYSVVGKNDHDDVPDGWANFALYVTRGKRVATVEAIQNPFRRR